MPLERSSDVDDVKRSAFIACSSVQLGLVAMSASLNAALDIRPRPSGRGLGMLRGGNGGGLAAIDRHAELGYVIFDNFEFYKVTVFLLIETVDVFEHIGERCDFFVIELRECFVDR